MVVMEWIQNGESQNSDCYKTANHKTAITTKQRLLQNRRLLQNDDCQKKIF